MQKIFQYRKIAITRLLRLYCGVPVLSNNFIKGRYDSKIPTPFGPLAHASHSAPESFMKSRHHTLHYKALAKNVTCYIQH